MCCEVFSSTYTLVVMRFVLFDGKKALKNLYMPKGQKTQWSKEKETKNYIEIHRLVFCVVFCLSFCMFSFGHCVVLTFSFGHCVVWPFLLAFVLSGLLRFMDSDYPFNIFLHNVHNHRMCVNVPVTY